MRRCLGAGSLLGCLLGALPVHAAEPLVALKDPDPATCVQRADLAAALQQAGIEIDAGEEPGWSGVVVEVRGMPEGLVVVLQGGGFDVEERLDPATCGTATGVVAAFVASAIQPTPAVVVQPAPDPGPPPSTAEEVEAGDELAVAAGRSVDEDLIERWQRLEEPLREIEQREHRRAALGIVSATVGAAGFVGLAFGGESGPRLGFGDTHSALLTSASGIAVLGGIGSFLVTEDYATELLLASYFTALGNLQMSIALLDAPSSSPYLAGASAAGLYTSAGLVVLNGILRPRPIARLRAAGRRGRAVKQDEAEIARVEADLEQYDRPIPPWITYGPIILGGAATTSWAIAEGVQRRSIGDGVVGGISGLVFMSLGVTLAIHDSWSPSEEYRATAPARAAQWSLSPGPGDRGGLSIVGQF